MRLPSSVFRPERADRMDDCLYLGYTNRNRAIDHYSGRTSAPPGGAAGLRRDLPSARRTPHPRISPA